MSAPDAAAPARFPCHECGAALVYAPGEAVTRCPFCGAENEIEPPAGPWAAVNAERALAEQDLLGALEGALDEADMEETRTVHCDSCGADVEFDEKTHAGLCPFCASPIVTETTANRHIKPKGVLPFGLTERDARKAMMDWLGRLWFAPSGLKEYARAGRPMEGLYVPYWTYDANTRSRYRGERGDVYYVTRQVPVQVDGKTVMQTRQVPKIRWSPVSGQVSRFFDDVLVLASRSLPKKHADGLGPWDLSALRPYRPAFLAGFRAEAYTVPLKEGYGEARAIMDQTIRRDIRFAIGGDQQRIHSVETDISDATFKHILLPVWLAAYKFQGCTYRFIVNGRTGAVQGERPWSRWKIALAVVLGLIAAGGIGYMLHATGALR
ncbi:primosomal protein N' (replication factor Y) - superfamily II helicase [Pikeienuella sp. HZG-20]|uniref:primosomal protein N' (replication factor Y) - superfamily II helicase n=1 Tax=Paludibacillus litoralis TaxID=3133267 RepID=UPI0030EEE00C